MMADIKVGVCFCGRENVGFVDRCICGVCFSSEIDDMKSFRVRQFDRAVERGIEPHKRFQNK